jgi:hypothetical protein
MLDLLIMERAPDSFSDGAAASLFATLVIESAAKENTICVTSAVTLNPHRFSHYARELQPHVVADGDGPLLLRAVGAQ